MFSTQFRVEYQRPERVPFAARRFADANDPCTVHVSVNLPRHAFPDGAFDLPSGAKATATGQRDHRAADLAPAGIFAELVANAKPAESGKEAEGARLSANLRDASSYLHSFELPPGDAAGHVVACEVARVRALYALPYPLALANVESRCGAAPDALPVVDVFAGAWGSRSDALEASELAAQEAAIIAASQRRQKEEADRTLNTKTWRELGVHALSCDESQRQIPHTPASGMGVSCSHAGRAYFLVTRASFPFEVPADTRGALTFHAADEVPAIPASKLQAASKHRAQERNAISNESVEFSLLREVRSAHASVDDGPCSKVHRDGCDGLAERVYLARKCIEARGIMGHMAVATGSADLHTFLSGNRLLAEMLLRGLSLDGEIAIELLLEAGRLEAGYAGADWPERARLEASFDRGHVLREYATIQRGEHVAPVTVGADELARPLTDAEGAELARLDGDVTKDPFYGALAALGGDVITSEQTAAALEPLGFAGKPQEHSRVLAIFGALGFEKKRVLLAGKRTPAFVKRGATASDAEPATDTGAGYTNRRGLQPHSRSQVEAPATCDELDAGVPEVEARTVRQ